MRRSAILVVLSIFIAGVTNGQSRGGVGGSGGVRTAGPAATGHIAAGAIGGRIGSIGVSHLAPGTHLVVKNGQIHIRASAISARPTTSRRNHPRSINPQVQQDGMDNSNPVPGLGYDAVHWAATHGQGDAGHRRPPRQFAAYFPFFDGGFLVAPQTFVEDEPSAEAPQEENAPQTEVSERRPRVRSREQPEMVPPVNNEEPQRESEQYVFVRRDGTIIFAVAYTWDKSNLEYVTSEGLRRSVALDSLDLDATRQFNEQRGLNFRLPA